VAQATENRQAFKDRLYRDMFTYHMFKADQAEKAQKHSGTSEEQNMQLLVRKYEEAVQNPYKLKCNREFLML
jgi:acetyl-CoA acetyltransferase